MRTTTTTLPAAPRHRARARLAAVVGAVVSAVAVWLIAHYGTCLHLHTHSKPAGGTRPSAARSRAGYSRRASFREKTAPPYAAGGS